MNIRNVALATRLKKCMFAFNLFLVAIFFNDFIFS